MRKYFAYIRVSTAKQGERGSSLPEQRDAIVHFAARNSLEIVAWFEERETATKVGRLEFSRLFAALRKGKAAGVIFHKIDRSARNLKDWTAIQDLADEGIDVRFAQESVNLSSNEGKLTGDFLAVISSHYIRNLREEVKKGMRGRLKQGIYPWAAPIGYLDQGGGKAKVFDPIRAPFIKEAFATYARGDYSLRGLSDHLYERGLRNRHGRKLQVNTLQKILRNPFYAGTIRMRRTKEIYAGIHELLIEPSLFRRVQDRLDAKWSAKVIRHEFLYRRMIACSSCPYHLIGERQKGHIYYRCHTPRCATGALREEAVEGAVSARLKPLFLSDKEVEDLRQITTAAQSEWSHHRQAMLKSLTLKRQNIQDRLQRLMDAYLDAAFDRQMFEEKKLTLLLERKGLELQQAEIVSSRYSLADRVESYLEPMKGFQLSQHSGNTSERREIVESLTSNLTAHGKNLVVKLRSPFEEAANELTVSSGGPVQDKPRTRTERIFQLIVDHCKAQEDAKTEQPETPLAA